MDQPGGPEAGPIAPVIGDVPLIDHPAPIAVNQPGHEPTPAGDVAEPPLPLQRDVADTQPADGAVPTGSGPVLARSLDGPRLAPEASRRPMTELLTARTGMVQRALRLTAPLTAIGTDSTDGGGAVTGPEAPTGWSGGTDSAVPGSVPGPVPGSGVAGSDGGLGAVVAQRQAIPGAGTPVRARWHTAPPLPGRGGDPVTAQTLRSDASRHGTGPTPLQRALDPVPGAGSRPAVNGTSGRGVPPSPGGAPSAMHSWADGGPPRLSGAHGVASAPSAGQGSVAQSGALPLAHPAAPAAVQRSVATLAATPAGVASHGAARNGHGPAPSPAPAPAAVQRSVEIDEVTTSAAPEGGGGDPAGESEAAEPDVHALAAKLYRPLRNRLMNELRLDRERNGITTERRR